MALIGQTVLDNFENGGCRTIGILLVHMGELFFVQGSDIKLFFSKELMYEVSKIDLTVNKSRSSQGHNLRKL